jgi:hypothetical protein
MVLVVAVPPTVVVVVEAATGKPLMRPPATGKSVMTPAGVMRPTLLTPASVNQRLPSAPPVMPMCSAAYEPGA